MIKVRPVDPDKLIKCLKKLGFHEVRQKWSHKIFKDARGRLMVVPYHKGEKIGRGLVSKIIKMLNLSVEKFYELVNDP